MARKTWEERKALLDAEKAADGAYVLAKKAYTTELNQIEEDRKAKFIAGWGEMGKAVAAGLLKWQAEEKKFVSVIKKYRDIVSKLTSSTKDHELAMLKDRYEAEKQMLKDKYGETQKYYDAVIELDASYNAEKAEILKKSERKFASIIKGYRDIWKEYALSEKEYKLEMLGDWYAAKEQKLWDDYGATQKYYDALAELDKAYGVKREAILVSAFEKTMQKIFAGARDILGGLDAIFSQLHSNEAMRLDNEEKRKTDAIENWYEQERAKIESTITNEEEKVAALEALDEEKARKENKLQHKMDKERRKLERAKAKSQKASAIFSATISMAEAIVKALTAGPLIGQIFAGIVAGLAAIQIAAIAAAPLPELQKGGAIEGPAIVGEAGPELFVPPTPGTIIPLRREGTPVTMTRMRIIIQNKIIIGEQTFYKETVKSVNKAGELKQLVIPNTVVV